MTGRRPSAATWMREDATRSSLKSRAQRRPLGRVDGEGGEEQAPRDERVEVELGAATELGALDDGAHDALALERREEA